MARKIADNIILDGYPYRCSSLGDGNVLVNVRQRDWTMHDRVKLAWAVERLLNRAAQEILSEKYKKEPNP